MTPERYKEVGQLYRAALEVEPERRAAFLAEACGGDEMLRQEVESLLDYATRSGGLIDRPALEVAAKAIAEGQPWFPVGQSLGHYQILSLLGKGGMGEVFGIILCRSKIKIIVEYALRESNKPIGVAAYRIVSTLPDELRGQLPSPEQVAKLLEGVE